MPAIEIVTSSLGVWGGKEILDPTGDVGNSFNSIGDWIIQKRAAQIQVLDVTNTVIVKGVNSWAAFSEQVNNDVIRTVFEIK